MVDISRTQEGACQTHGNTWKGVAVRLRHHSALLAILVSGFEAAVAADPLTKEVEVNGFTMSYVEDGTGEPIVFVHGAVMDARAWEPVRAGIAGEYHFIAPTLRYFGSGDWPDDGLRFGEATHAEDVAAFIEALGLGPVHLVGRSYGASVAAVLALQTPDLVQSLILWEAPVQSMIPAGEAGAAARDAAGQMFGPVDAASQQGDAEKAMRLLIEGIYELPPGGWDSLPQEVREMQLDNARTMPIFWSRPSWELTCEMLGQVDMPVLVAHGGESNAFWQQIAEGLDECLPQAELATLAGAKHNGPVSDPVGFARLVKNFVAQH
jgi:pimeloyl-ACP methyl ester carboxylesterase